MTQLTQLVLLIVLSYLSSLEPVKVFLKKSYRVLAISGLYIEFGIDCLTMYTDKVIQPLTVYSISKKDDCIVFKKDKPGPYVMGFKGKKERYILTKVYSKDPHGFFDSRICSQETKPVSEYELPSIQEEKIVFPTIKPFWSNWTRRGTIERLSVTMRLIKTSSRKKKVETKSFYDSIKV